MMLNRRRAIQVIASAAASPALAAGQGADVLRWEGFALGATCSIAISVGQQAQSEAALDAETTSHGATSPTVPGVDLEEATEKGAPQTRDARVAHAGAVGA